MGLRMQPDAMKAELAKGEAGVEDVSAALVPSQTMISIVVLVSALGIMRRTTLSENRHRLPLASRHGMETLRGAASTRATFLDIIYRSLWLVSHFLQRASTGRGDRYNARKRSCEQEEREEYEFTTFFLSRKIGC